MNKIIQLILYTILVLKGLILIPGICAQNPEPIPETGDFRPYKVKILLNAREQDWLNTHKSIRVGVSPDFPPFIFKEGNTWKGIYTDYFRLIKERTGIKFEMVSKHPSLWDAKAKAGELDMFPNIKTRERKLNLDLTQPFMNYKLAIFNNLKIAGLADLPDEELVFVIRPDYPELTAILNKAISSISKEEHEAILQKWYTFHVEYKADWSEILPWILAGTGIFISILAISFFWNRRLVKEMAERKKVENSLQQSEEQFRAMFENHQAIMYLIDPENGKIVKGNKSAEKFYGYPLDILKQMTIYQINQLSREEISAKLAEAKNRQSNTLFFPHRLANGEIREMEIHSSPIPFKGKILLFSIAYDITERRMAEKSLRVSLEKYRVLFESFPTGVSVTDDKGRLLEANSESERLLGVSIKEHNSRQIDGKQWNIIRTDGTPMPPDEYPAILALKTLKPVENIEMGILKENNEITWINVHASPVPLEGYGVIIIYSDVTLRRQMEEELLKAKEDAEAANRAKSAFLASMSHEIRTPLNGVLGYAQILKADPGMNKKQIEGLDVIEKSGNHLLSLLNDILDLAKIESGKIELYETDFNFQDFIQNICNSICIRTEKKDIVFINENINIPLYVYADERRLRQILINLLENSVKFTDNGSVKLKVEGRSRALRGIKFSIEDTGIGIASDDLQKIFDKFYQSGEQKYQAKGTGLGLSITRNLIELMGGKLKASSEAGKGSTFSFILNLPEVHFGRNNKSNTNQRISGYKGKRKKILIIDDNHVNLLVFMDLLEPLGFEIINAENGREGLERALEFKPEVILTDIVMPEMNGIELIRQIRHSHDLKDTIIFAASASVYREDQKKSLNAGADSFLSKPIQTDYILDQLQQFLSLEWTYDKVEEKAEELSLPCVEIIKKIHGFAQVGAVFEVQELLQNLEKSDKKYKVFIDNLDPLLNDFLFDEIAELMENYLNQD